MIKNGSTLRWREDGFDPDKYEYTSEYYDGLLVNQTEDGFLIIWCDGQMIVRDRDEMHDVDETEPK